MVMEMERGMVMVMGMGGEGKEAWEMGLMKE